MGFILSFLLKPLLDFLRGGLVGFVRCRQSPKHPPALLRTRCRSGTEPRALQCPWLGLPATLALSGIKKKRDDTWLGCFRQKTLQDESSPKSNKAICCQTEKDVQENNLGLESIPSSKHRYPSICSCSALAEVTRNTTMLTGGDTAPGLHIQLSVFYWEQAISKARSTWWAQKRRQAHHGKCSVQKEQWETQGQCNLLKLADRAHRQVDLYTCKSSSHCSLCNHKHAQRGGMLVP